MKDDIDRSSYKVMKSSTMETLGESSVAVQEYRTFKRSSMLVEAEDITCPRTELLKRSRTIGEEPGKESASILNWGDGLVLTPEFHERFLTLWTVANVVGLLFTVYLEPFAMTHQSSFYDMIATTCIDVFFTVDTILRFFMAYPYYGAKSSVVFWECRIRKIITRYISFPCSYKGAGGWFWIDVLSILPGWLFHLGIFHEHTNLGIGIRLFRLMRFRRANMFTVCFEQCHELYGFRYWQLQCVKLFLSFTLTSHVLACLWLRAAVHGSGHSNNGKPSWLNAVTAAKGYDPCDDEHRFIGSDHFCYYSLALYWSIQTLTSVGYGDMTPQNQMEYMINLVCMVMASAVWTWLLAEMVALLEIVNADDKEQRLRTDRLHDFTKRWQLCKGLQSSLSRYNRESRQHRLLAQEHSALREEISMGLERRIVSGTPAAQLLQSKVWWIRNMAWDCVMDIVAVMRPVFYGPKEIVHTLHRMVLIQKGELVFKVNFLGPGDLVGEVDILFSVDELVERTCPYTLLHTNVLMLHREDLMPIVQQYPLAKTRFRRAQVRMSAWRGFIHAAKNDAKNNKIVVMSCSASTTLLRDGPARDTVIAAISSVGERLSDLEKKMGLMMDMINEQRLGKTTTM